MISIIARVFPAGFYRIFPIASAAIFGTLHSEPCFAQSACGSKVVAIHAREIPVYNLPTGARSNTVAADSIPAGTEILECHANRRIKLRIATGEIWIDGFMVRTDAEVKTGRNMPLPSRDDGGVRGAPATVRGITD